MKCLEKDRSRRYDTANGLAADIHRHLADEPVTAGAPSAGYQLQKFVKRNRGKVIAAGAVVAALLIGVIAFATQAKVASDQRDFAVKAKESEVEQRKEADAARAEAEAQKARALEQEAEAQKQAAEAKTQAAEAKKQAAIAEAVAKFQTDMLAAADPQKLLGDKVTVLQAMQGAVKELDKGSLKDQPLVEAGVRDTIGTTLRGLARYDEAEPNLRKSLEIRRAALPAGHPDIAKSLNNLALLLLAQNKLAEAEPLFREALAIDRAALPAGHPNIATGLNNLAMLLQAQNKLAEAEPLFREALAICRAALPAGHSGIALGLNNLAVAPAGPEQARRGRAALPRSACDLARGPPAGHPDIAVGLNNLAVAPAGPEQARRGRAALPRSACDPPRGLSRRAPEHCDLPEQPRVAPAGPEQARRGRAALARSACDPPRGPPRRAPGHCRQPEQPRGAPAGPEQARRGRAALPRSAGDPPRGPSRRAPEHRRRPEQPRGAPAGPEQARRGRAALPRSAGDPPRGPSRRAPGHCSLPCTTSPTSTRSRGRPTRRSPLLREVLEANRATLPKDSPELAGQLALFSQTLLTLKAWDEAEPLIREALTIREAKAPDDWRTFNTKSMLGGALLGQKKLAEAEPLLLDGYRGMMEREASIPAAGNTRIPEALERLVQLYEATGNAVEAAAWRSKLEAARAALSKSAAEGDKR